MKDWTVEKIGAVGAIVAVVVIVTCITIYAVTKSNNERTIREAELQEEARKAKASDDLKAAQLRAEVEVREAEIQSKKRKLWERDAEGVEPQAEAE